MSSFADHFAEPEIELCYNFWGKYDNLGLVTWVVSTIKITKEFYFDENINVDNLNSILNGMVEDSVFLLNRGWKVNFNCVVLRPESINNFSKKVNFILEK